MLATLREEKHEMNGRTLAARRIRPAEVLHPVADPRPWLLGSLRIGLACYALTSLLVMLGVSMGHRLLAFPPTFLTKPADLTACYANWDGGWFTSILSEGYSFRSHTESNTAFFPAYPCLAWLVMKVTGNRPEMALLIVSHVSLAGALVVLAAYVRLRFACFPEHLSAFVLLAAAAFPTTFFFRMAYSESLFFLGTILSFYLIERRAPLTLVALAIGFTTAIRIPGICLLAPFILHVWRESATRREFLKKVALLTPLACWGIIAFVVYCTYRFGEPMAFAKAQATWHLRVPSSWGQKMHSLATLEPVRAVFDSSSPGYWKRLSNDRNPFFSLVAANPLYFMLALALIAVGVFKRWLSTNEWVFGSVLLLVSYAGRGYEMCMNSSGRFVAVVFPIYLVLGQLLYRCPPPVAAGLLACSTVFLTIYSALFAACYFFI